MFLTNAAWFCFRKLNFHLSTLAFLSVNHQRFPNVHLLLCTPALPYDTTTTMSTNRGIVVFSGGSAANNLVDVFDSVRESKDCPLSYIIPISDNGGSSSELIRVFGGPGIGDVRSMTGPNPHSR